MKKRIGLLLFIIVGNAASQTYGQEPAKEVWLTIFVHGIMSIKPHINLGNFLRFMRDDVEDTPYAKTVEFMRCDEHFFKNQAMQHFGLIKIDPTQENKGNASSALARILTEVSLLSYGPSVENHYYTYGWSGLMSVTNRYKEAIGLYKNIDQEAEKFIAQGITPKIRVVGYSHGGNVVLNLGAVRQQENVNKKLRIDQAVLLGTPIQCETDYLIHDDVFKKVYHLFSWGDRVQKMDFFSYKRFFSQRIFRERRDLSLPSKLVQVQIKITRTAAGVKNNPRKFAAAGNFKNSAVVSGKSPLLRDSSPGHAELWFFGWTPVHYRTTFSLNPLPALSIMPFILKTVEEVEKLLQPQDPVIIDIRPEYGVTLVKNVKNKRFHKTTKFIPDATLTKLREIARPYFPDSYTCQEYDKRIHVASLKAQEVYEKELSLKARRRNRLRMKKQQPTPPTPIAV